MSDDLQPAGINPTEPGALSISARQHRKRELGNKLLRMIQDREWTASELARRAGINKDVVSTTINAKSYPSHSKIKAMAQALGVPVTELSVAYEDPVIRHANVEMGAQAVPGQPGRMRLTVNKVVRSSTALKVLNLLESENVDAADRG